jgi:hypothetical protein
LAYERTRELCYPIARILASTKFRPVFLGPHADGSDLEDLQRVLARDGVPDRSLFSGQVEALFKEPEQGRRLIQSIYFGLGAGQLSANPIWSKATDPRLQQAFWESPLLDPRDLARDGARLVAGSPLDSLVEERRSLSLERGPDVAVEDVAFGLHISDEALDLLAPDDVRFLRQTLSGSRLRRAIGEAMHPMDVRALPDEVGILLAHRLDLERSVGRKAAGLRSLASGAATVLSAVACVACLPQVGVLCTGAGLDLRIGKQIGLDRALPLRSFSEGMRELEERRRGPALPWSDTGRSIRPG